MKESLDIILVERRLVESRTKAQWLIVNGFVKVNGKIVQKPRKRVENSLKIELEKKFPYVARRGLKLEVALKKFFISVAGKICLDINASIGGFTDCLLKHGAKRVYVIDKATDLLHPSLKCKKNKGRVIPILGVDARKLIDIAEEVDICTIDITYRSLKAILPKVLPIMKRNGNIIALIKPSLEVEGQNDILDPQKLYQNLINLTQWCISNQIFPVQLMKSPTLDKKGAIEFLINLKLKDSDLNRELEKIIKEVIK